MRPWDDHLQLGKGSAFVKRDLRILPQTDAEFEADFFLDPRFSTKRRESWIGMVIEREFAGLPAMESVRWPPPTVNDLATLLAHAMERPPDYQDRQRPRIIYLRDRPQWKELLPHLQQLGVEVILAEALPWFDEAAVEFIQRKVPGSPQRKTLSAEEIRENLKRPFPPRKRTSADAVFDLLRWTDDMLKAGYPSPRKGTPAVYDPMLVVPIALSSEDLQAILTKTAISRTKKLRPRLEAMKANPQDVELSVSEWGQVIFSLCGSKEEGSSHTELIAIARQIADCLSQALGIEAPEGQ